MKKITLLFVMLAVSFGYAQTLPLDFSDPGQAFGWDPSGGSGGAAVINETLEKLEVFGNGNQWDNAFILFAGTDVVDLSDNDNNSITFKMQSTDAPVGEVHTHRIKIGTTLGAYEQDFTTTGQVEETFVIDPPNALGDLNELRFFVDSGVATNPNSDNGVYLIDDIAVFVPDPATDASLSALEVDSNPVSGFSPVIFDYTISYPPGTTAVPVITTATASQAGASVNITDAMSIPGVATVDVTASNMTDTATYTINYVFAGPSTAATDPPLRDAGDVASVFTNGIYGDVDPSAGVETFGGTAYDNFTTEIADDTRRVTFAAPGSGFQFLYLSNAFDLTDLTHIHMDIFIDGDVEEGQVLTINLINQPGTGDTSLNTNISINAVGSGAWYSADIPLDSFNGAPLSRDAVTLIQIVGAGPSTYGPLYFDNLYFYKINDTCADATPIALNGDTVSVSNIGATDSGIVASCDSGIISDVWYSFEATATGEVYFETTAPNLSVFSDCTGTTELACNPGISPVSGLTMGTTYYVRINDDGTARAPGTFTLTASDTTLGIDDLTTSEFKVYPNPTNNDWNIRANGQDITSVQIFDILGKNVMSVTPNSDSVKLDASGLPAGLYFAKMTSESGTKSVKLVKQ
jgi:hypothetical protein